MPDLDTDPSMVRHQQDKDTPEHIDDGDVRGQNERHDSDAASAKDREALKEREPHDRPDQMDAILAENTFPANAGPARRDSVDEHAVDRRDASRPGLAGKGRSRLGE